MNIYLGVYLDTYPPERNKKALASVKKDKN